MFKKVFSLVYVVTMALSLVACGGGSSSGNSEKPNVLFKEEVKESNVFYAYFDENDSSTLIITSDESKGNPVPIHGVGGWDTDEWDWYLFFGVDPDGDNASDILDEGKGKISKIVIANKIKPISTYYMFHNFVNLKEIVNLDNIDLMDVTDFGCMFAGCENLTDIDLSRNVPTNPLNMFSMFAGCDKLRLNLHNWVMNSETKTERIFGSNSFENSLDKYWRYQFDDNFDENNHLKLEDYIDRLKFKKYLKELDEKGSAKWDVHIDGNVVSIERTEKWPIIKGEGFEDDLKRTHRGNASLLQAKFRLKDDVILNYSLRDTYGHEYNISASSEWPKIIATGFAW